MEMSLASVRSFAHLFVERYRPRLSDPIEVMPAVLVLVLSLPLAMLVGVPTGGIGLGVALGATIGGAIAVATWRAARQRTASHLAEAAAEADRRDVLVTRQYEWAVNDVANLRDALRKSQTARVDAEAYAKTRRERIDELERVVEAKHDRALADAAATIRMRSRVYDERALTWLRLESIDRVPEQIRVRGADEEVVGISTRLLEPVGGGPTTFVLRISDEVAASIARHDGAYAVEGLMNDSWLGVALEAESPTVRPAPTRPVLADKRGRVYKPEAETADSAEGESVQLHRA